MRLSRSIGATGFSQSIRKMCTSDVVRSDGLWASKTERIGCEASSRLSWRWPSPDSAGVVGSSWLLHDGQADTSASTGPQVRQNRMGVVSPESRESLVIGHLSFASL